MRFLVFPCKIIVTQPIIVRERRYLRPPRAEIFRAAETDTFTRGRGLKRAEGSAAGAQAPHETRRDR